MRRGGVARTAGARRFAVCASRMDRAGMTDPLLDKVVTRARSQAYKRHSDAYRWLRERHAVLAPVFAATKPPWREIAAEMVAGGVLGGRGKPLKARALAGIWARVCRDVVAAEAKQQATQQSRKLQPSRMPADWRPAPAPSHSVMPRTEPRFPVQDQSSEDPYAGMPDHVRKQLEKLDVQIAWRDRFVIPLKR